MSKNLATTTVATAPSPATSGTSLTVATGTGSRLYDGMAVLHPAGAVPTAANAEVVSITVSGDVVTLTRAQESSTARTVVAGDILTQGITAAMWDALVASNAGKAAASHVHSAADVTSGTLPLTRGGTGGTDAAAARTSLGLGTAATMTPATIAADPALTATYAPQVGPLARIDKARTGPFRILVAGTSIAADNSSAAFLAAETVRDVYGDSGMVRFQGGLLGGTFAAHRSWTKQPYSGVYMMRARGTSASQTQTFVGAGDQIVIEWSRESDTGATEVLVDGVSVGTFGAPGTQKFGMQTVFTVAPGGHSVVINPPASGICYLEAVEIRYANRVGVEIIDGTMGGSGIGRLVTPATASGDQTAPIATTPGAGIEAYFGRSDIDLIIEHWHVNDAGDNTDTTSGAAFRARLDAAVAAAEARQTPIVAVIEPAGHYAMPAENGSTQFFTRYAAIKAHIAAVAASRPLVTLADWDTPTRIADPAAYAAAYYSATVTGDAYTGDFIHPDATKIPSLWGYGKEILVSALGLAGRETEATTRAAAPLVKFTRGQTAIRPTSVGTQGAFSRNLAAWYRDVSATNLRTGTNTAVNATGLSDANGKYMDVTNYSATLGSLTNGQRYMLTVRIGPNGGALTISAGNNVTFFDPAGNAISLVGSTAIQMSSLSAGVAYTIAVVFSQSTANSSIFLSGRVYEASLTASDYPLLCAAP